MTHATSIKSQTFMELEKKYGAQNYAPLPVVLARGLGTKVWDVDGKEYLDFLSAYSAVNQGHCHPKIIKALKDQSEKITLTSRAFYHDQLGPLERWLCAQFGFERMIPMNSGAEAVETAIKLTRKWGYEIKKVPENQAIILFAEGNFHGRTLGAISASTDGPSRKNFGPLVQGYQTVPYNNTEALKEALKNPNVIGFIVEPIQGEAGVLVPDPGYLRKAYELCKSANALFVADEVQTGLARTGRMFACDYESVKPDILIMGKALSGGVMPISAVMCSSEIMLTLKPGEHGSTFGGSPLASAVAKAAVEVIFEEKLAERAMKLGEIFRSELKAINSPIVELVRGKGLLNAIVITPHGKNDKGKPRTGVDVCHDLIDEGVLAKQTHVHAIRFAPPLVISESELERGLSAIRKVLKRA